MFDLANDTRGIRPTKAGANLRPEVCTGDLAVSVVIPTFNRAHLIERALASARAALALGDAIIVVDDGSTDATSKLMATFGPPVHYLPVPHGGAGAARNAGIRAARNPLVAFLDSDDEWWPDKLTLQRRLMAARPEVLFCCSDFGVRFDSDRPEQRRYLKYWHRDPRSWDAILGKGVSYTSLAPLPPGRSDFPVHVGDLYPALAERAYVATFTLMVRREEAGEALHFAEDLPTYEDWECFGRLARAGMAAYLDCETAWQWGHGGPRLTNADTAVAAATRLTLLERVWGADSQFMARHGDRYRRAVSAEHRRRALWLLKRGRIAEARQDLDVDGVGALLRRIAAGLSGLHFPWI
jgi:GT2 family glycosyltransferase